MNVSKISLMLLLSFIVHREDSMMVSWLVAMWNICSQDWQPDGGHSGASSSVLDHLYRGFALWTLKYRLTQIKHGDYKLFTDFIGCLKLSRTVTFKYPFLPGSQRGSQICPKFWFLVTLEHSGGLRSPARYSHSTDEHKFMFLLTGFRAKVVK